MLFFVVIMAISGRDWGPMYFAELKARKEGWEENKLVATGPSDSIEPPILSERSGRGARFGCLRSKRPDEQTRPSVVELPAFRISQIRDCRARCHSRNDVSDTRSARVR